MAGIILAKLLAERGRRVLLLEAGGLDYSDRSQSLYNGETVGREYFYLNGTRLRYLGGSSNHWDGWCRPLDPYDFEKHSHNKETGWPIDISDLEPYLAATLEILELEDFPPEHAAPESAGLLKEIFFRYSPPVRFGEKYLGFMKESKVLDVMINANVIDVEFDGENRRATSFVFRVTLIALPSTRLAPRSSFWRLVV